MRTTGSAGQRRTVRVRTALALIALGAATAAMACDREPLLSPPDGLPPGNPVTPPPAGALGLVEVTISGIGTANQRAMAMPYGSSTAFLAGVGKASASTSAPIATFDLGAVTNNTAITLDGAGDYITADGVSDALAGADAYTIEAWVYPQADTGDQQTIFGFHTSTGDNVTLLFYTPDDSRFSYFIPPGGYGWPPVQYDAGRWYHVALVVDGDDGDRLYIDGTAQTSLATPLRPEAGGFFSIGQEYDGATATDFFRGRIDEVRVWNVARTQIELQADMHREIDPATPGLVSYYRFDEASGSTLADLAGDNDGTLVGDAALGAGPALEGATNGDGTIQLEPVSTGSFTVGDRGSGGFRYVHSTFRVRNAQTNGTAYGTPRTNLTFLGVDTDGTLGHTAVSALATFGGTEITGPAASAIAEGMIPTGAAYQRSDGSMHSIEPDVLQVLSEAEAASVDLTGTTATDVFPYGFVVRTTSATPGGRVLSGSPAADQFDGLITFAFKVPLQANAADDPFAVRVVFLPHDDDEVRITQSLEEQGLESRATFETRAAELGADRVTLLPGGDYSGAVTASMICEPVRVAGAAGNATGLLFDAPLTFLGLAPDPYAIDGSARRILGTTSIGAAFDAPVDGASDATFSVHGAQSGRSFVAEPYTGNGTPVVATPAGSFFPGEVVEVTLTRQLGYCPARFGHVARYRAAAVGGSGTFSAGDFLPGSGQALITGDLDGDRDLDVATADGDLGRVFVQLDDGNGAVAYQLGGGSIPLDIAAGDLDGDGDLDLVTANAGSGNVSVLLNDGFGQFASAVTYSSGAGAASLTPGDFDGDGDLDIAVANSIADNVAILLNVGNGTFAAPVVVATGDPNVIVSGDLDGDGDLDLVVANTAYSRVTILENARGARFAAAGSMEGVGFAPSDLVLADLDGDGDLDLVVTADNFELYMVRNLGNGSFNDGFSLGVFDVARQVAAADLDGDGDIDLAATNFGGGTVSILENDGGATFSWSSVIPGISPSSVAVGDADADGDIDLFVVSEDGFAKMLNN